MGGCEDIWGSTTVADSVAANRATISKRARAATGAQANFNIRKLFGRIPFGWRSLFSYPLFLTEQLRTTRGDDVRASTVCRR